MDGASSWETLRYVTLPLLGPTIRIWAFLAIIGSIQLFDIVWIMTARRAGGRVVDDGDVHDRPGRQQLPDRLRDRGRRDPVR